MARCLQTVVDSVLERFYIPSSISAELSTNLYHNIHIVSVLSFRAASALLTASTLS